jgi:hypothetical protein
MWMGEDSNSRFITKAIPIAGDDPYNRDFLFTQMFGFVSMPEGYYFVLLNKDLVGARNGTVRTVIYKLEGKVMELDKIFLQEEQIPIESGITNAEYSYAIEGTYIFDLPKILEISKLAEFLDSENKTGLLFYNLKKPSINDGIVQKPLL